MNNLREQFEKENGYDVFAYRQDYGGQPKYKDGFSDDYVKWLEVKCEKLMDEVEYLKEKNEYNPVKEARNERDRRLSG